MRTFFLLSLLVLMSCNGNNSSSSQEQTPITCDKSTLCMQKANWTITSSPVNFPENFSLAVRDQVIYDSCNPNRMPMTQSMDQQGNRQLMFKFFEFPSAAFKLEILDRGVGCDNHAIFFSRDHVTYTAVEVTVQGRVERNVRVELEN